MPAKLGKYEVRREIGRGGMGVVYEGFDTAIERRVALKTLKTVDSSPAGSSQTDSLLVRLKREAQAAGRLTHPNIVAVYDFGEEDVTGADGAKTHTAFIAMEFVEGRELASFFTDNERFPPAEIVRIMSELLDALEYSHSRGVVHRDIKPANIILLKDGTVKVADFGIARIESSTLTQVGTVLGSPSYMSPEQFMGQTVDGRSDLYSAGVVLYQLLTAEVPFTGAFATIMHRVLNEEPTPPSVLNVQVPKAFDSVLRRAMAKRPDERFQTAAEFKQAVIAAAAGEAGMPPDFTLVRTMDTTAKAIPDSAPSKRSGLLVAAAAVLLGGGAAAYLYWSQHSPGPEPVVASNSAQTAGSPAAGSPAAASPAAGSPAAGSPAATSTADAASSSAGSPAAGSPAAGSPAAGSPAAEPGTYVVSAVGLADPENVGSGKDAAETERLVWEDARRQLIFKAAALYVDPASMTDHYQVLRSKLLNRSGEFIKTVLEQQPPTLSKYGLMLGTMRATVKVRDVQKSLNEISREQRIEFIRNNGDPRISINVRALSANADPSMAPERSAAAENILAEHIRSFGFVVVDEKNANPPEEFRVDGEVRFKKLSARLPASGLTIEKYVITSWTVKAVDALTGEVIYNNTAIPQKQSWASEELAMKDVGGMIGREFSKQFFLQYYNFAPTKVRLRFSGLPISASIAVLPEINSSLRVLNAGPAKQEGNDMLIDADLSGGSDTASDLLQGALIRPLNHKLGKACFTVAGADAAELRINFDAGCTPALNKLESSPPEALIEAPEQRIEDVVKDPKFLHRLKT
jgi:serine/threonine-protein kinase